MGNDREGGAQRPSDPKGENGRNSKVCQGRGTPTRVAVSRIHVRGGKGAAE